MSVTLSLLVFGRFPLYAPFNLKPLKLAHRSNKYRDAPHHVIAARHSFLR
jgi:hypothetical protein